MNKERISQLNELDHGGPYAGSLEPPEWAAYLRRRHAAEILRLRHRFIRLMMSRATPHTPQATASVDEIRDDVKAGVNPKVLGMICRNMAGVIERVGWKNSASKACHGRPIATWRLVSWQAADKWLADNPIKTDDTP